jgi:hypothetical protein
LYFTVIVYFFKNLEFNGIESISPNKTLLIGSKNPMQVKGKFSSFISASFKFTFIQNTLFATTESVVLVNGSLNENTATANIPSVKGVSCRVEISFNNGTNYHLVNSFNILDQYIISKVIPVEAEGLLNFFSTRNVSGLIYGSNFVKNGELKLILKNSYNTFDISSISNPVYDQTNPATVISFTSPSLKFLNVPYDVLFPFKMDLGVSFNGGHDYVFVPYVYVNSCMNLLILIISSFSSLYCNLSSVHNQKINEYHNLWIEFSICS